MSGLHRARPHPQELLSRFGASGPEIWLARLPLRSGRGGSNDAVSDHAAIFLSIVESPLGRGQQRFRDGEAEVWRPQFPNKRTPAGPALCGRGWASERLMRRSKRPLGSIPNQRQSST
jgi:hypothetical protein